MKKHFYSDLIHIDSVVTSLSELQLTDDEKKELTALAHAHLHQVIMDAILNELSSRDKKIFLANVEFEDDEKIWEHLNSRVEKIHEKIISAAEDLKEELHKDIAEVKNAKKSNKRS